MLDGMTGFILLYGWVGVRAVAAIAVAGVRTRMHGIAIIGIDHMARRASRRPVVTGVIVGAHEGKQRIEQARFLQALEHRIRARQRPKSARTQAVLSALEDAQHVSRLSEFELRQRLKHW